MLMTGRNPSIDVLLCQRRSLPGLAGRRQYGAAASGVLSGHHPSCCCTHICEFVSLLVA